MNERIISELTEMGEGVAAGLALELVDVELVREGGALILRYSIDKPGGVFLDDCEAFHRAIDVVLDERDPIPGAYNLEVASPGLDRPLKKDGDFARFAGELVTIRCFEPWNGKRQWRGRLIGLIDGAVTIETAAGPERVPRAAIARVRLDPQF